ncbi:MAG: FAD-dependent oxidoreductase [Gammaproteobacteria bacterium]|nr:FAD-dependent oxidoreductase [Gammaproteobacteria bacterium]
MVEEARCLAFEHIGNIRDHINHLERDPSASMLEKTLAFAIGRDHGVSAGLIRRELDLPHDPGAPSWCAGDIAPGRQFRVAIVGAGMSGILVAHRLQQAGIDYTVFEKSDNVGGTWSQNTYPGCRLDTPNFAYSYAFAQNPHWPSEFSEQRDILKFFDQIAEKFSINDRVRLNTEVVAAHYQDETGQWQLRIHPAGKALEEYVYDVVISAVGQLGQPKIPEIAGAEEFAGKAWHTARWNHEVSLRGRRVGVIGTGASAYQVVPAILSEVAAVVVFQRNPPWMLPTPRYHEAITVAHRRLLSALPHYARWVRFFQVWATIRGRWDLVRVDETYRHPVSVSAANEALRQALEQQIQRHYADRPDLLRSQLPNYPPGAKRMLRDNGVWPAALKDPKVFVETRPISGISHSGVSVTADGSDADNQYPLDILIYATGFRASEFLLPMEITGSRGRNLHEWWHGEARAYLGMCVPGFPNFFCMYGPNTNLVVHGSLILFAESSANFIMECLKMLLEKKQQSMTVTDQAFQAFNEMIDHENTLMAWGVSTVSSWYKNDSGRVTQNWPLSIDAFYTMTEKPLPAHFSFEMLPS